LLLQVGRCIRLKLGLVAAALVITKRRRRK